MNQPGFESAAAVSYGVGYVQMPRIGLIEPLHALEPGCGRALCGAALTMSWSPEDSAGIEIDCQRCLLRIEDRRRAD